MTNDQSPPLDSQNSVTSHQRRRRRRRQSPPPPSNIVGVIEEDPIDGEDEEGDDQRQLATAMPQNPNLQRYLVAIEYIGTRFCGAQQQLNGRTVVGALQKAFHKFIGQPVSIYCSSRTDAGVHALSNVFHVDVERISKRKPDELLPPYEAEVVKNAVNHFLQKNEGDVMVTDVRCVAADFHSRYKAQERTYFYRLLTGPESLSIFEKDRAWHVPEELNLLQMQKACEILVGCHDFSSFRAAACQAKSPIKTLDELSVTEIVSTPYFPSIIERESQNMLGNNLSLCSKSKIDQPYDSSQIKVEQSSFEASQGFGIGRRHRCFVVTARAGSFLYHQVRLLVGVLKAVGTGDITLQDVERILNAKTVSAASPMAPACGLYLGNVKYDLP